MLFRLPALSALCLSALAGCGVIYTSPSVSDGGFFGSDTDYDVQVVDLTYETASAANL